MYRLSQIIAQLGGKQHGNDIAIHAIAPAARATTNDITFLANPKYKQDVLDSHAGV